MAKYKIQIYFHKMASLTLASMARLVGASPSSWGIVDSIPGWARTCIAGSIHNPSGHVWEAANQCFSLTSMFLSLPSCLPSLFSKSNEKNILPWG